MLSTTRLDSRVGRCGGVSGWCGSICSSVCSSLLATRKTCFGNILDVKTKSGQVDVTMAPEKESTESRLSQDVKDAIEDCLGVGRDDIATLREVLAKMLVNGSKTSE